jgi:hypothetical protein
MPAALRARLRACALTRPTPRRRLRPSAPPPIAQGRGTGIDVGGRLRREFVVAGPPLEEMSSAEGIAGHGEVVVGPTVWSHLLSADHQPLGARARESERASERARALEPRHAQEVGTQEEVTV